MRSARRQDSFGDIARGLASIRPRQLEGKAGGAAKRARSDGKALQRRLGLADARGVLLGKAFFKRLSLYGENRACSYSTASRARW